MNRFRKRCKRSLAGLTVLIGIALNVAPALAVTGGANISVSNGVITLTGEVPVAKGGTGAATATAAFNALSPTTSAGQIIYHDGTNDVALGVGTSGQYLRVAGGAPAWETVVASAVNPVLSFNSESQITLGTGGAATLFLGLGGKVSATVVDVQAVAPSGMTLKNLSCNVSGTVGGAWTVKVVEGVCGTTATVSSDQIATFALNDTNSTVRTASSSTGEAIPGGQCFALKLETGAAPAIAALFVNCTIERTA